MRDLRTVDLGFQGGTDIPTPSLDAIAAGGMRLSNGYVTGTWCSPTRAGLLTGRYQQRFGDAGHESVPDDGLSLAETTIADRCLWRHEHPDFNNTGCSNGRC